MIDILYVKGKAHDFDVEDVYFILMPQLYL
jgi:hypothetical protein